MVDLPLNIKPWGEKYHGERKDNFPGSLKGQMDDGCKERQRDGQLRYHLQWIIFFKSQELLIIKLYLVMFTTPQS